MGRTLLDYGPTLLDTIEVGDRFVRNRGYLSVSEVVGKVYNDDLTISYRLVTFSGNRWTRSLCHETNLRSTNYKRSWKGPRSNYLPEMKVAEVYGTA